MPASIHSDRPILANSSSKRGSTYSRSPSTGTSDNSQLTMPTASNRSVDINDYTTSLHRLDDKRLQEQRYVVSPKKEGDMNKLALASKVERALNRRYQNQDAIMKPRKVSEKA